MYSHISRLDLNPMLALFDFPDPNAHSAGRTETTTPLQKLFVLNSEFMVRQSKALVKRLRITPGTDDESHIKKAYHVVYGRPASGEEIRLGLEFLTEKSEEKESRWIQYAQVLLSSNEMLIID